MIQISERFLSFLMIFAMLFLCAASCAETLPEDDAAQESVGILPAFSYTGEDPIEAAVLQFTLSMADWYRMEDNSVAIPAPDIFRTEYTDDTHARVYGNFWILNYTLAGDLLECISGGEAPGVLDLALENDTWVVTGKEMARDGAYYTKDIQRFCNGDKELEKLYFSSPDINGELTKTSRYKYILDYVRANDLPVKGYKDYGWDPVMLEP